MMKKVVTTVCILMIFTMSLGIHGFCISNSSNIAGKSIDGNVDDKLLQVGYPQIIIDTMDMDIKKDIIESNLSFLGAKVIYCDNNQKKKVEAEIRSEENDYRKLESMEDSPLILSLVYSRNNQTSESSNIHVAFHYKWNQLPLSLFQDQISVTWDENRYYMEDNSFKKVDKYSGYILDLAGNNQWYYDQILSREPGFAQSVEGGVRWYADLKGYIGVTVTELYGYGSFWLIPKNCNREEKIDIQGVYSHEMLFHFMEDNKLYK